MFRCSRVVLSATRPHRVATGIAGLPVHPNPLPHLTTTYKSTLSVLSHLPQDSVYRQATEALLNQRLKLIDQAKGDVAAFEKALDAGMVEQVIEVAEDELGLAGKMIEWKAYEPLQVKPAPGQWEPVGSS